MTGIRNLAFILILGISWNAESIAQETKSPVTNIPQAGLAAPAGSSQSLATPTSTLTSKQKFDLKLKQQLELARARYRERLRRLVADDQLPPRIKLGDLPIDKVDPPQSSEDLQRRTRRVQALNTTLLPQLNRLLDRDRQRLPNLELRFDPIPARIIRQDRFDRDLLRLERDLNRQQKLERMNKR